MSAPSQKPKRQRNRSRPAATSSISLPAVEDASTPGLQSAFTEVKSTNDAANSNKRYAEPSGIAIATGEQIPHDPSLDAIADREAEGALDADLAELSLGQRLAARNNAVSTTQDLSTQNAESTPPKGGQRLQVPAHSLTRTLIQALHAGDTSLLEACLTHSDEALIRNTVTRLPPQLSVPLLTACVERLGRGPRGNRIKGRGGGASAQRGLSLMKWVRAVLIIHSGYLMAMPDLVARLSHLYSTLSTRLALQDRLLSLSGRLDLVLAQVEVRSSNAPAPLPTMKRKKAKRGKPKRESLKYVESESSEIEGEESEQMEVETEDDEGSVENVELGENSEEGSEDEDGDSEDDENEIDDANLVKGLVDDEAEEDYDDDESEEESE